MAPMRDLTREQLLAELRKLRIELESEGVTHLALFGSRARADNKPDSDIDLIIDIDETRKFSLLDLVGVSHTIGDRLELETNIVTRRSLEPEFASEIQRDLVEVF